MNEKTASPVVNNPGETITIRKDTLWKYSTFILAAILIVGAFVFFLGDNGTPVGNVVNNGAPIQGGVQAPSIIDPEIDGYPTKGSDKASVVMVEYTDFQCPFCGRYYSQTYGQIVKDYVDTGKVKYVLKDFPLSSIHPNAQKAAESTHCVRDLEGDEGYWKMHDKIFEGQGSLSLENLKKWARDVGADGGKFDSCLDSGKMASIVQKSFNEGSQDGVQGTPSFIINGKAISGAMPYESFKQAIDAEL